MCGAPRANNVRLLTPRNHWFWLIHKRARCEVEEGSRRQDGGCRALRDLGGRESALGHRLGWQWETRQPRSNLANPRRAERRKRQADRAMLEETARHSGDATRGGEEAWRQIGNGDATIRHSRP
ncbi:hypothetical protein NDU88_000067 [Pleurodeles waltl]|uniref:Uncharacterized protein n=1 Tax=Pleurodeles waltl TaxID=8319 RepID=A0AAV7TF82_PLEWA|nr:hypothetical protein NDU88_000067 [Pleurodeles waltl]